MFSTLFEVYKDIAGMILPFVIIGAILSIYGMYVYVERVVDTSAELSVAIAKHSHP